MICTFQANVVCKLLGFPDKTNLNTKIMLYCATAGSCALEIKSRSIGHLTDFTRISYMNSYKTSSARSGPVRMSCAIHTKWPLNVHKISTKTSYENASAQFVLYDFHTIPNNSIYRMPTILLT